jgi:uncharacterized protein (TIGR03083 family)
MLQPPQPIIVVDLFPEILDQLLSLLTALSAEEWNKPTVCAGWSVRDVAAHLLGVEVGNLSRRRDGHAAGASVDGWDELVAFVNEWNQEWVRVARRISSRLLIDWLRFTGGQMCEYLRRLDPFAMGSSVSWAGPGPAPVWLDVAREYTERWHHQQHIRDAVDQPGLKDPRFLGPVLETFTWALPRTWRRVSPPDGTSISLAILGASGGQWTLLREEGRWDLYQGAIENPDTEIMLDEDVAWRLFTRGVDKDNARQRVSVRGNESIAEPVFEMVAIIA